MYKGRQFQEKTRENNESNMQEHMYPIQVLLASTQVKNQFYHSNKAHGKRIEQINALCSKHRQLNSLCGQFIPMQESRSSGIIIISNYPPILSNNIITSIQHSRQQAIIVQNITSDQSFGEKKYYA
jgi:hypothetical protein